MNRLKRGIFKVQAYIFFTNQLDIYMPTFEEKITNVTVTNSFYTNIGTVND